MLLFRRFRFFLLAAGSILLEGGCMAQNQLAGESSPYLLQHKDNPVHWFPWGDAAFAKAKKENKPIFLSIGYSTCHWCHVMAKESFENPAVAEILNRDFISIKVDREERPDVDRVYMAFVQATTGSGGWPMSVWLTPEGEPFFGGTYFPPEQRYGRAGFGEICQKIAGEWKQNESAIRAHGTKVLAALAETAQASAAPLDASSDPAQLAHAMLARSFDKEWGGFGAAPKFPRPSVFRFLFRYAHWKKDPAAREMALHTLRKMAAGGMHDHLGGGFHRYSVDEFWHVPHFEKMLYDQAQLVQAYVEAWQITRDPEFAARARDILAYVDRDLTSPAGGFYSAEDADSSVSHENHTHVEGAFYVWTLGEIRQVLGEKEAEKFAKYYGVEAAGNASESSDPHGEFRGKNILIEREANPAVRAELAEARAKLLAARNRRPRPHLDDKILTAWNALMISAYAKAGSAFGDLKYLATAERAVEFIRKNLWSDSELYRSWREGKRSNLAFAEDYAFLISALLDLYEATFDARHLAWARELQKRQDALFWDDAIGAYYSNRPGDPHLKIRMKEDYDGAEPAANSVSAENLIRLGRMDHDEAREKRAATLFQSLAEPLARIPHSVPYLLNAWMLHQRPGRQIVLAGAPDQAKALLEPIRTRFLPEAVVLHSSPEMSETVQAMQPIKGQPAVYLCENFTCRAPITDPAELQKTLKLP